MPDLDKKNATAQSWEKIAQDLLLSMGGLIKKGAWAAAIGWLIADPAMRQLPSKIIGSLKLLVERGAIEGVPQAKDLGYELEETVNRFRDAVVNTIMAMLVLGLIAVVPVAFVKYTAAKAVFALIVGLLIIARVHLFWAEFIPLTLKLGVAFGLVKAGQSFELTLGQLRSLPSFIFGGAIKGLTSGLEWVGDLWRWVGMTVIWVFVGLLTIVLGRWSQTPELVPVTLLLIPIWVFGPLAWPWPRATQNNWVIWASVFVLIDLLTCTFFPDTYHWICKGSTVAMSLLFVLVVAEAIGVIYIVHRRPKMANSNGTAVASPPYRDPHDFSRKSRFWSTSSGLMEFGLKWVGGAMMLLIFIEWILKWDKDFFIHAHMLPVPKLFGG